MTKRKDLIFGIWDETENPFDRPLTAESVSTAIEELHKIKQSFDEWNIYDSSGPTPTQIKNKILEGFVPAYSKPKKTAVIEAWNEDVKREIQVLKKNVNELKYQLHKIMGVPSDYLYFAGGMFASILQGETPKDIDVFLRDDLLAPGHFSSIVSAMTKEFKEDRNSGYQSGYNFVRKTYRSMPVRNLAFGINPKDAITYNLIHASFNSSADLLDRFDFTHTQTCLNADTLFMSINTYNAIKTKTLRVNPLYRRIPSSSRIDRFLKRGYSWDQTEGMIAS